MTPPDRSPSLGGETFAALFGTLVPGIAPTLRRAVTVMEAEVARTRSVALRAAERQAGMNRDDLLEAIAAESRLVPLLQRLLYAAGMNEYDPILTAMGEALGRAVDDAAAQDESMMLLDSLNGLTLAHVQVLRLLTEAPDAPSSDPLPQELQSDRSEPYGWGMAQLHARANLPAHVVDLAVAALAARSMVDSGRGFGGGISANITPLGSTILELLEAHRAAQ